MVHRHRAVAAHYAIRAALLAGLAYYIVLLVRTGSLDLYIADRMQPYVKLSALGLYVIASQQLYSAVRALNDADVHAFDCGCDHEHELPSFRGRGILLYGWFALPLAFGFFVPDGQLGSVLASAKGMQFAPGQIVQADDAYAAYGRRLFRQPAVRISDDDFVPTLTTLDLYRGSFVGRTISVSGFVFREDGMGPDRFGVGRFAISCCSADVTPYGLLVSFERASSFDTDEWVIATGKLSLARYRGTEVLQLEVEKAMSIPAPFEPYVSADADVLVRLE
ncbi:TIGR03943 family putative permease subunit [Cohnella suwonensis]|uniref:TIGR03943 family putative permease subunit n=1 Tax=Cohnella suwonensis TaxID=696072 RepID=A0ABW0LVV0_9BACL